MQDVARRTTNQERTARQRLLRAIRNVVLQWTNGGSGATGNHLVSVQDHQGRLKWVRRFWPQLVAVLDEFCAAADNLAAFEPTPWPCPACGADVTLVRGEVDPRTATHVHRAAPCGCPLTTDEASDAFGHGIDPAVVPINGSTLAAAARARHASNGYDLAHDLARGDDELPSMIWCLLDAAAPDAVPTGEVPAMWPRSAREWRKYADLEPWQLEVEAAALLHARIDVDRARHA